MYSTLVQEIGEAGSIRINQMVYDLKRKGRDITVLSLGEAFFNIPMFNFGNLDFEKGYHYSDTQGLPELRSTIARYYQSLYGVNSNPDKNILVSAGSKIIIYMCMMATVNPGDEVIVHEPYWLSYPEQVKLCHAKPIAIPHWVRGADFKKYLTNKTKLVILNNPNNPSGRSYQAEELKQIYELCRERNIHLLVDEAYSDFCIRDEFYSAGLLHPEFKNVIVVNSLSKSLGMSGWRIGYMLAHQETIYEVLRLNQHLITCCPTILASYSAKYFDQILEHTLPQARKVVEKRDRIASYMDNIDLKYLPGSTTFYFFVDIQNSGLSSMDFSMMLLEKHGIATVPGSCYGLQTDSFVRVGIGTESEERIQNALNVIHACCNKTASKDHEATRT